MWVDEDGSEDDGELAFYTGNYGNKLQAHARYMPRKRQLWIPRPYSTETIHDTVKRVKLNGLRDDCDEPYDNVDIVATCVMPFKPADGLGQRRPFLRNPLFRDQHLHLLQNSTSELIQSEHVKYLKMSRIATALQQDVEEDDTDVLYRGLFEKDKEPEQTDDLQVWEKLQDAVSDVAHVLRLQEGIKEKLVMINRQRTELWRALYKVKEGARKPTQIRKQKRLYR
jgi:hypothetical protein